MASTTARLPTLLDKADVDIESTMVDEEYADRFAPSNPALRAGLLLLLEIAMQGLPKPSGASPLDH